MENLFTNDDDNDDNYYKPIFVKSSFKNYYKYYESRGDKDKKLSVKQYLYKIMPYLSDLINDHKTIRNESNEWKIQINMHVNFIMKNNNEEIRSGNETDDIIKRLINSFLTNYRNEEAILRNGSGFVFESVDLLSYSFHKISLKREKSLMKSPE